MVWTVYECVNVCGLWLPSWRFDLGKTTSKGVNIGIDISSAMFPTNILENASFHKMSIVALALTWDSFVDFVRQRLLIAAFTEGQ